MNEVTEAVIQEWALDLNLALSDIKSKSSSMTPYARRESAANAAIRAFKAKESALARVKNYLDVAESILKLEGESDGS